MSDLAGVFVAQPLIDGWAITANAPGEDPIVMVTGLTEHEAKYRAELVRRRVRDAIKEIDR